MITFCCSRKRIDFQGEYSVYISLPISTEFAQDKESPKEESGFLWIGRKTHKELRHIENNERNLLIYSSF